MSSEYCINEDGSYVTMPKIIKQPEIVQPKYRPMTYEEMLAINPDSLMSGQLWYSIGRITPEGVYYKFYLPNVTPKPISYENLMLRGFRYCDETLGTGYCAFCRVEIKS